MYIDSLTYEQFMVLGDAELSRRFSMQDEAEQKAKIDREQANDVGDSLLKGACWSHKAVVNFTIGVPIASDARVQAFEI